MADRQRVQGLHEAEEVGEAPVSVDKGGSKQHSRASSSKSSVNTLIQLHIQAKEHVQLEKFKV